MLAQWLWLCYTGSACGCGGCCHAGGGCCGCCACCVTLALLAVVVVVVMLVVVVVVVLVVLHWLCLWLWWLWSCWCLWCTCAPVVAWCRLPGTARHSPILILGEIRHHCKERPTSNAQIHDRTAPELCISGWMVVGPLGYFPY